MQTLNITKRYAVYFRFNEIIRDIKQRFGRGHINLNKIHEQIADEFGYESTRSVTDAINFIRKNLNNPYIQRAIMLFSENRINYWAKYNSEQDIQNIEKISEHISPSKNKTRTPFIHYFIYMRYKELASTSPFEGGETPSPLGKGGKGLIYDTLADEFYYQNPNSVRNIIKKTAKILCKEPVSVSLTKIKNASKN